MKLAAAVLLALLLCFTSLWGEDTLPQLSAAVLESFPAELRSRVQEFYDRAHQNPDDAQAAAKLGMLMHAYEQHRFAEVCYRKARQLKPDSFPWAYYLGVAQALAGKAEEAVDTLRNALRLSPDYLPARLQLADALLSSEKVDESGKLYREIIQDFPTLATAHYGLGRVKAARGELSTAVDHYQKACELFEDFGAAHYALGLAYRDLGQKEKARQHFARYQNHPSNWPTVEDPLLETLKSLRRDARQYLKEAVSFGNREQFPESIERHKKALELDPKLVQAHVNLIRIYGQLQDWAGAEEHYRQAGQINSNLAEAHYNYGVVLTAQGRYQEAADLFQKALEINPLYSYAHNNLGYMLELQGKIENAERHYRESVANDPNYGLARFNLGRILVAQKNYREAIQHFSQLLTPEDENTPRYTYALAAAYVRSGDLEKGLHYAQEAKRKAESLGQAQLAATIDKDLQSLKEKLQR